MLHFLFSISEAPKINVNNVTVFYGGGGAQHVYPCTLSHSHSVVLGGMSEHPPSITLIV